jgi:hypothetical protein
MLQVWLKEVVAIQMDWSSSFVFIWALLTHLLVFSLQSINE